MKNFIKRQAVMFVGVGTINTLLDFVVFNGLIIAKLPIIFAGIISTSTAMAVSYLLNGKAVFKDGDLRNRTKMIKFTIITIFGVYVLQYTALYIGRYFFGPFITNTVAPRVLILADLDKKHHGIVATNIAKLAGVALSMFWNFVMYKKYVYVQNEEQVA